MDLLKFAERLEELISESGLNKKEFASKAGLTPSEVSKYLTGECSPTLKSLIKTADFCNCTTDYVLGLENEKYAISFKPVPPFSERLKHLLPHFGYSGYSFCKQASKISASCYYDWLRGKREPSVESIINIAEFLGCGTDFVIGRSE